MDLLNVLAFIFAVYFLIAIIIVHFFKKDHSFKKDVLSKYALGKWSFIMTLGFLVIGFSQLILSSGFFKFGYIFPFMFLALSGLGALIVGIIKISKDNKFTNKIHKIGVAMQFIFFPLALISYSIFSKKDIFSLIIGLITFIFMLIIGIIYQKNKTQKMSNFGLIQKTNIFLMNIWLIVTSYLRIS